MIFNYGTIGFVSLGEVFQWEGASSLPVAIATLSMKGAHFHRSNLTLEGRRQAFSGKGLAAELRARDGVAAFQGKANRFYNKGLGRL